MEHTNEELEVVKVDDSIQDDLQAKSTKEEIGNWSQFFQQQQPNLLLRHQQIQHQQQILSQWFQKEEESLLLKEGTCQWPGCEKTQFSNKITFQQHLNSEHSLSQCSAAQAKVQFQIVAQLEQSLVRERERFHAMMSHLNKGPLVASCDDADTNLCKSTCNIDPQPENKQQNFSLELRKTSELLKSPGFDSSSKVLDTETEIMRNREFYRLNDVRPPYTYASLIRQAIVESSHRQLTLNEIYTWFQDNFAYFRRNAATWKNAIRTNLSLHKCFVRYEDDFGSFWTVDDREFLKRRHLSRGRPRKYDPSTGKFESLQSSPPPEKSPTPPLLNGPPPTASNSASTQPVPAVSAATAAAAVAANFIDFTRLIATNHAFTTSN